MTTILTHRDIETIVYEQDNNLVEEDKDKIAMANYIILETNNLSSRTGFVGQALLYANSINKKLVSIASQNPYDIMFIEDIPASLVIYGYLDKSTSQTNTDTFGKNLAAGVATIFGDIKPAGKLPVEIESLHNQSILYHLGHGLTYNNTKDLSKLESIILKGKSYNSHLYTGESFDNLNKTIVIAESLISKYNKDEGSVSQKDIERANQSIKEAILNLELIESKKELFFNHLIIIVFLSLSVVSCLVLIKKFKHAKSNL